MTEAAINNRSAGTESSCRDSSWNALWSVIRFGVCTAIISVLLSLLITPFIGLSWLQVVRRCVSVAATVSLLICIHKLEGKSLQAYGLKRFGAGKGHLAVGLLFGLVGLGIMLSIGLLTGSCSIDVYPDSLRVWRTVLGFVPAAILVSVLEELVFRGFLLQQLLGISRHFALIASSALYAAVHLKQRSLSFESWMELTGLFLLGAVLAWSYFTTGQLWLGIGLHASLAYGARVNKLLVAFSDSSKWWLVGTSRLVNGLSAWVALLIVGFLVWLWVKWTQKRGVMG